MSLDQRLRQELRTRASTFVPGTGLLTEVRRRQRRNVRRRRALIALAAFAALVAVAIGPALTLLRPPSPAVDLVDGRTATVAFPLTPTWEPAWVGLRTFSYQAGADRAGASASMNYEPTYPRGVGLTVRVGPWDPQVTGEAITVGPYPATIAETVGGISLAWRTPGEWVQVLAVGPADRSEVMRFAESLREVPLGMDTPFVLASLPADAELSTFDRSTMEFARLGAPTATLTITLVTAGDADRPVDEFRGVRVIVDPAWGLTEAQVDTVRNGVQVTAVALTAGG